MRVLAGVSLVLALVSPVLAQPAGDKGDAKSLLASGLKLYADKDYLGALSVFETAYARFPSGKILLNIGTTLVKLDRKADAANAYQGYLDSPDVNPAKLDEVTKVLAELDAKVVRVHLTVTPADAEVQLENSAWMTAAKLSHVRAMPGEVTVRARKTGFKPAEKSAQIAPGHVEVTSIVLEAEPVAVTSSGGTTTTTAGGITTAVVPEGPPSKLGVFGLAHVDAKNKGGAALLGVVYDIAGRIQLQAAALLGPSSGGYAGAAVALLTGRVRPLLVAGVPIFVANGARVAVRGAVGVEVELDRHLALVAEIGVEHLFNPEADVTATLFIPAVGVIGRL